MPLAGGASDTRSEIELPRTLLLREGLRSMGMGSYADLFMPDMLECTEDGKPFLPGLPDIHFNLSHSGDYIACAFSDQEVGLDLQEHSRPHTSIVRIAKRFFPRRNMRPSWLFGQLHYRQIILQSAPAIRQMPMIPTIQPAVSLCSTISGL